MTSVALDFVTRFDAAELIRANIESRSYHEPWVQPFTDAGGFEDWFGGLFTGANVGLVARDLQSGGIVGVVTLSQIFGKGFQNAFLDYFGMVSFARVAS
jgi:[ribosomal protein S5]-alanine N-acetyltransferase